MGKRTKTDRRQQPTPIISRYILRGRRSNIRRRGDKAKEKYVDRYNSRWLFLLGLILVLNCLDSLSTFLMVLRGGGRELNPIVKLTINLSGKNFWVWKLAIVSFSLVILGLHSQLGVVRIIILLLCALHVGLVYYQYSILILDRFLS